MVPYARNGAVPANIPIGLRWQFWWQLVLLSSARACASVRGGTGGGRTEPHVTTGVFSCAVFWCMSLLDGQI